MAFKNWSIIYPSKKVYNELKTIENNIKPFYKSLPKIFSHNYTRSFFRTIERLNKIEESVNKFKKTKIIDEDGTFHENFPAISSFLYEAYYFEESVKKSSDKKFINIAQKLYNKLDFYKSIDIFSTLLIL